MKRKVTPDAPARDIDAIVTPLIERLGGRRSPTTPDRGCGTMWAIDSRYGAGSCWHLSLNGTAALVHLELTAARSFSLATAVSDFSCFGLFERGRTTDRIGHDSAGRPPERCMLLGYAWKNGVFRGALEAHETLTSTCIYLLPEALTTIASAASAQPAELAAAIALLDGTRCLPHLCRLFEDLRARRLAPGCAEAYYRCKTVEACALLIDWVKQANGDPFPHMSAEDMTSLNNARTWIEMHLHEPICLEDLCRATYVGPSKLAALFKELDGTTPMEWVRNRRMERACELLTTTAEPLGSIAARVGFAKHGSFSAAFKARYGMTPSRYRALHRNGDTPEGLPDVLFE